ncbi:MAG: hypothetical protein ABL857_07115 [Rickettsiales bacterium]
MNKTFMKAGVIVLSGLVMLSAAATNKTLNPVSLHFSAQQSDCFKAAKNCMIEVNPSELHNGYRFYSIAQICDCGLKYHYDNMKTQIQNRAILGMEFCNGVVSLSTMGVPFFSRYDGFHNANDGLLLVAGMTKGIGYISSLLPQMLDIATRIASGSVPLNEMNNLNTVFQVLLNEINFTANITTANGFPVLGYNSSVSIPVAGGKSVISVPSFDMATGSGLNISSLSVDTVDKAHAAIYPLQLAEALVERALSKVLAIKPVLETAAREDEVITTVDLTGQEFIVRRSGGGVKG